MIGLLCCQYPSQFNGNSTGKRFGQHHQKRKFDLHSYGQCLSLFSLIPYIFFSNSSIIFSQLPPNLSNFDIIIEIIADCRTGQALHSQHKKALWNKKCWLLCVHLCTTLFKYKYNSILQYWFYEIKIKTKVGVMVC